MVDFPVYVMEPPVLTLDGAVFKYKFQEWGDFEDDLHEGVLEAGGSIRAPGYYQADKPPQQEKVERVFERLQLQPVLTEYEDPVLSNPFLLALHIERVTRS